jgi:hypothetical protein
MAVSDVAAYLDRVPCYRRLAERFLRLDPAAMARWLLGDLEKSGAVRISEGRVRPTAAA